MPCVIASRAIFRRDAESWLSAKTLVALHIALHKSCMKRLFLTMLVFNVLLLLASGCAIDTPTQNSRSRITCGSAFDIDSSYESYFDYSGNLNGLALSGTAIVTPAVPVSASSMRQVIVGTGFFSLTINLASSAYGVKTIATGNPEVWLSAVTCADYYNCSSEKYVAGYYNATLRGSGTVTLSRTSTATTQITANTTLPDENTSVSQALQFQNLIFTEACY